MLFTLAPLVLSGCSSELNDQWARGGLPEGVTDHSQRIETLWQGAWAAAFITGAIMWALILGACVVYRRKATDTGLPPQVRYNLPVEVLYTTLPIVMVLVYFYFTARDQNEITEVNNDAAVNVSVVGKRWSWDFNYLDAGVFESGTPGEPPTLYLPVGEKVHFDVVARDVIHAFWVPQFLYKMDMIPGRVNSFELTPTKTGIYAGKCAELCGTYHARMLFNVAVVEREEYDRHLEELRAAGNVGDLTGVSGPEQPRSDDSLTIDPETDETESE
ncbi:aa3-type cytochrome oxidase subunit II [Motilibacter aurantiacus]|uniref:aa3-type cytochrome oxidase subunit II n=1 Tax=Motilibacter aurantiacus TaxID=2714955 RepID=UPI00140B6DA8|nr:cytochrome c oxidase subunit II [Motilibacter aurantiacus]NHC44897.1 cytochrome c oxidase subunit II [Motilibacter aurantiacus]